MNTEFWNTLELSNGNADTLHVLADKCFDECDTLGYTLQWMAANDKWPHNYKSHKNEWPTWEWWGKPINFPEHETLRDSIPKTIWEQLASTGSKNKGRNYIEYTTFQFAILALHHALTVTQTIYCESANHEAEAH